MNYTDLVWKVMINGMEESNQRTGIKTRRLLNQTVELTGSSIFSPRKFSAKIAAAEVAWMLSGQIKTGWLSKYTSIWRKFEEPEGVLTTAYGYRWRYAFQRDQVKEAIELLKMDPSSRQALVISWDARTDGLMQQGKQKNVPCPFAFSLYIVAGKGHITVYQRSADVIVGIPYDLLAYYILGRAIFNSVGVEFDGVSIMIGDAHVYETFYNIANRMSMNWPPANPHLLKHQWNVEEILEDPDRFVSEFARSYEGIDWPMTDKLEACA